MLTRRAIAIALGLLGWAAFGVTLYYDHKPPAGGDSPEAIEQVVAHGYHEAPVTKQPPPAIATGTPPIKGTVRLAGFTGSAMPTGEPPKVQTSADKCAVPASLPQSEGAKQAQPNWTLAPENLGIETWALDVRKTGRRAWYAFRATVIAQTPDGDVRRTIKPDEDDTKGWVSSDALGIPPRFGPYLRATTLPTLEAGFYWSGGRAQWDAGGGYDFDRRRPFVGGGVRF